MFQNRRSPVSDDEFAVLADRVPGLGRARRIAVGVSGGADSMALALLARPWVRRRGIAMTALTVDHGLRAAAGAEARRVAAWMGRRDIPHVILRADGSRPTAAMQALARTRRFDLIDRWCRDHDHDLVLFAHTAEDQAETLWLRVLAESGPDGLSAMAPVSTVAGLRIARPMLTLDKERLVATCLARQQPWIEDPSNRDMAFTRVRLRRLAPTLATGGLGIAEAGRFVACMAALRSAHDRHCAGFLGDHGSVLPAGIVWFQAEAFRQCPAVFANRLLTHLLRSIGGRPFPPRRERVIRLASVLREAAGAIKMTLGGCLVMLDPAGRRGGQVWVCREPGKAAAPVCLLPGRRTRWDNRFEALWHGTAPVMLGALADDAGRQPLVGRTIRQNAALNGLPRPARLAYPVIRNLDGIACIPHFIKTAGTVRERGGALEIAFCPDLDWIRELAAARMAE